MSPEEKFLIGFAIFAAYMIGRKNGILYYRKWLEKTCGEHNLLVKLDPDKPEDNEAVVQEVEAVASSIQVDPGHRKVSVYLPEGWKVEERR